MVEIQPYRTLREGIAFSFRGLEPETNELLDIDLVVPSLNFDSLRVLQARLQKMGAGPDAESMETLVDALEQALARNYRGVPRWLITQTVDIANMPEMIIALMDVSGLKRKEIEEKKTTSHQANGVSISGMNSTPS